MGDGVVGIGDEGRADSSHVFSARHLLFLPYAESLIDLGRRVGKEDEGE